MKLGLGAVMRDFRNKDFAKAGGSYTTGNYYSRVRFKLISKVFNRRVWYKADKTFK
jgi:hypothetical protein